MLIDNEYFIQGFTASMAGFPRSACPLNFKASPFYFWNNGFEYGELSKQTLELDMEPLEPVNKSEYDQGQAAYAKRIGLEDCPYGANPPPHAMELTLKARADWIAGWLDARKADKFDLNYKPFFIAMLVFVVLCVMFFVGITKG